MMNRYESTFKSTMIIQSLHDSEHSILVNNCSIMVNSTHNPLINNNIYSSGGRGVYRGVLSYNPYNIHINPVYMKIGA